jgi:hypothetical protein
MVNAQGRFIVQAASLMELAARVELVLASASAPGFRTLVLTVLFFGGWEGRAGALNRWMHFSRQGLNERVSSLVMEARSVGAQNGKNWISPSVVKNGVPAR